MIVPFSYSSPLRCMPLIRVIPSTGLPRSAPSHLSQIQFSSSPGLKKILTLAFIDAAVFADLEPALGLPALFVDLLPQPDRAGLRAGGNTCCRDQRRHYEQ